MKNTENEVEVFNKETVSNLMNEGYTKAKINKVKAETKMLMERMEMNYAKKQIENIKSNIYTKGQMTFKEVYDSIDFTKHYNCEEIKDFKELCNNKYEGGITSSLVYLNNYRVENRNIEDINVTLAIKYLKSMVDNYKKFNSFSFSEECASKTVEAISYWDKPKNEAKKISIKIKSTMPEKRLQKYNLEPEKTFESQKALAEYCGVSMGMITKWKKSNYIEEIV